MTNRTEKVEMLDTDLCYGNPEQPRKYFNQQELQELSDSIKEAGQLQPGKVRPDGNGKYMIIMGERRWRACKLAGVQYKAVVVEIDDDTLALQAIIENEQRADVTPMEAARSYQAQIDKGLELKELAKKIGRRPSYVQARIDLLKLNPLHQMALDQGGLTIGQANQLARLSSSGQDALVKMINDETVKSYKDVCNAADAILNAEQQSGFELLPLEKPLTETEKKSVNKIEKAIMQAEKIINKGFSKDGEVKIYERINPNQALKFAEKLVLIKRHLNLLENDLRKGAIQQKLRS